MQAICCYPDASSCVSLSRDSCDNLCHKAQCLSELGYGDGGGTRSASQLQSRHQLLAKTVKEKLRAGQLGLQEHQAFEETLQNTWSWLREVQSKLAAADSTLGHKATLEKKLLQVQVCHRADSRLVHTAA